MSCDFWGAFYQTCRRDGNLQVWDMSNGEVVGLRNLNKEVSSVVLPSQARNSQIPSM